MQTKGFDPYGPEDTWPNYVQVMRDVETEAWKADARCRKPGHGVSTATGHAVWTTQLGRSKSADDLRQLALAVCWACPVQWECAAYAIITEDRWNLSGGLTAKERAALKRRKNWRDLLEMAREAEMSTVDLMRKLT